MSKNYIDVRVESRSGKTVIESLRLEATATVDDLISAIYDEKDRKWRFSPARQRLTLQPEAGAKSGKVLERGKKPLESFGVTTGTVIQWKDLGPQVGYKFVFFMEYLGPLLIYPFFWSTDGRQLLHGFSRADKPTTLTQDLALCYWSFHYFKRIFETFHIHKFSHATMPIFNLFRNCGYYWLFAAFVSYNINHPLATEPAFIQMATAFVLAYICQIGNLMSHITLSSLRSKSEGYSIPRGGLFNYVTCANYTYEIWGWIMFTTATQSLPAAIFAACGTFQMMQWAVAKHKRLRKMFDGMDGRDKYPKRWVILPPCL